VKRRRIRIGAATTTLKEVLSGRKGEKTKALVLGRTRERILKLPNGKGLGSGRTKKKEKVIGVTKKMAMRKAKNYPSRPNQPRSL